MQQWWGGNARLGLTGWEDMLVWPHTQILITALCAHEINSEIYSITNLHSGLEICSLRLKTRAVSKPSGLSSSGWQLRIPVVSVPVGWQRLRNICGDRLLSHSSLSLPPVTIEVGRPGPANYHESWSTQWAFFRASSFGVNASNKAYVLRNRLTGGHLRYQKSKFAHLDGAATVNALSKEPPVNDPWWLELDYLQRWNIVHHATGNRLEQSSVPLLEGGVGVECACRSVDARKTWVLMYVAAVLSTTIWCFFAAAI